MTCSGIPLESADRGRHVEVPPGTAVWESAIPAISASTCAVMREALSRRLQAAAVRIHDLLRILGPAHAAQILTRLVSRQAHPSPIQVTSAEALAHSFPDNHSLQSATWTWMALKRCVRSHERLEDSSPCPRLWTDHRPTGTGKPCRTDLERRCKGCDGYICQSCKQRHADSAHILASWASVIR